MVFKLWRGIIGTDILPYKKEGIFRKNFYRISEVWRIFGFYWQWLPKFV